MEITKTLYVTDRRDWRAWLKKNYDTEKDIWLILPNKASGKPRIEYNEAVEEALCFGWIDSTVKKYDEHSSAQRFSPRNPKTGYSQPNIERLRKLVRDGCVLPSLAEKLKDVLEKEFEFPPDIMEALKSNKTAWANWRKFSPVYQRIRVAFVEGARKRPDEFKKRLDYLIDMTEKNKLFGYGGIEKYF